MVSSHTSAWSERASHPGPVGLQRAAWVLWGRLLGRWQRWPLSMRRGLLRLGLLALLILTVVSVRDGGDFSSFHHAGARLASGEDPYQPPHYQTMPYTYGLIWTLVMAALAGVPGGLVNGGFSILSLYLVYRCWQLTRRALSPGANGADHPADHGYARLKAGTPYQPGWAALALLMGCLMARYLNFQIQMIQMTPLMLWGCLEAARLEGSIPAHRPGTPRGRYGPLWAGLIVGGLAAAKVLPLVMLGYWGLTARWRPLVWGVVGLCVALLVPWLVLGWARYADLMGSWWASIDPTSPHRTLETDITQHGLPSVIPGLLTPLETELPYRRHLVDLGAEGARVGLLCMQVVLAVVASLPALRLGLGRWRKQARRSMPNDAILPAFWALALMLAAVPLLLPQQQKYAYLMAAPLLAAHGHQVLWGRDRRAIRLSAAALIVWVVGAVLTDTVFLGTELSRITQHYKLISWAALVVIGLGVVAAPPPTRPWRAA